ncbi:MAG: response regulator [Calditrichaeota bacterium]|nr:MAG: response regulator [Calditrichota bacterium]
MNKQLLWLHNEWYWRSFVLRILVIEDDANTLFGLQELLQHEGFAVSVAENGKKALRLFQKNMFDVVLCDYRLPDTNGLQLCNDFLMGQPGLDIFMITAYNTPEIAMKAKRIGVRKIFTKPLVLDLLFEELTGLNLSKQKIDNLTLS